ncbi:MAG: siderophore-interacting protein [Thermoplasmata archaeon]
MSGITNRASGGLTERWTGWLFRKVTISCIEVLSERFRVITLAGAGLRDARWVPRQKIQITVERGANRTYTPFEWDSVQGETRILAFSEGQGPGAVWATKVHVGDACRFSGPRRSLDLSGLGRSTFLFGDETSFGLALALRTTIAPSDTVALLFEVSSVEESERAWQAFGGPSVPLVRRTDADAHLTEVETQTLKILDERAPTDFILTGKASSIQRVRGLLRDRGIPSSCLRVKAYWAAGRKGLD